MMLSSFNSVRKHLFRQTTLENSPFTELWTVHTGGIR